MSLKAIQTFFSLLMMSKNHFLEAAVYRLHHLIYPRYEFVSFPFFIGNNAAVQGICQLFPSFLCMHGNWLWFNISTLRQTISLIHKSPQRTDIRYFWIVMNANILRTSPGCPAIFWVPSNKKKKNLQQRSSSSLPQPCHTQYDTHVLKRI